MGKRAELGRVGRRRTFLRDGSQRLVDASTKDGKKGGSLQESQPAGGDPIYMHNSSQSVCLLDVDL